MQIFGNRHSSHLGISTLIKDFCWDIFPAKELNSTKSTLSHHDLIAPSWLLGTTNNDWLKQTMAYNIICQLPCFCILKGTTGLERIRGHDGERNASIFASNASQLRWDTLLRWRCGGLL